VINIKIGCIGTKLCSELKHQKVPDDVNPFNDNNKQELSFDDFLDKMSTLSSKSKHNPFL
jgi:hypothetical protein